MNPKMFRMLVILAFFSLFVYSINPRLLLGAILLFFGVIVVYHSWRNLKNSAKYEFNNTTNGGVVNFSNYDSYLSHKRSKFGNFTTLMLGLFFGILGLIGILVQFR